MRETRTAQRSIFDFYADHDTGKQLKKLSEFLDEHQDVLRDIECDLVTDGMSNRGRKAMSVESVFRCLLLKQMMTVTYDELAFHLEDSQSYRTFARLNDGETPSKSTLQSNIGRLRPWNLAKVFDYIVKTGCSSGIIDPSQIRIDSTAVEAPVAPPSDSKLLNDCVRVLCRLLAKSKDATGVKVRFTDLRKGSKSIAYRIFHAKKAEKDLLYEDILTLSRKVYRQATAALIKVKGICSSIEDETSDRWIADMEHYIAILEMVIDQTERRIFDEVDVPAEEKIVSIFELHTDIIVKGKREVKYGHLINVASDANGCLTHVSIEDGNPGDVTSFIPVIQSHKKRLNVTPTIAVADGAYASTDNIEKANGIGVKKVVFSKKNGVSLSQMGIRQKTYDRLKNFRAGIEGNISEMKRALGLSKVTWKGLERFHSYVWSSVIAYNLCRLVRLQPG